MALPALRGLQRDAEEEQQRLGVFPTPDDKGPGDLDR